MSSPVLSSPYTPRSPLSPKYPMYSRFSKWKPPLSRQMTRGIGLYLVVLLLVVGILNTDYLPTVPEAQKSLRRNHLRQKPLSGAASGTTSKFPKKIWQTWRIDPLNFEERDSTTAKTWTLKNTGFRYEVLTDNNDVSYVEQHFGPDGFNRPDIVDFYKKIDVTIIKADLLRYMIMYAEGGVYADIDVEALKPVQRFIPLRFDERDIDMVVGVEIDQPHFKDHPFLGRKSMSFCQWTFMCKPRLPVMLRLIEEIMAWLDGLAKKQGKPINEVQLNFDDVIAGTGPSAFTTAILEEMNANSQETVTWESHFHDMDESKVVSRVLVLDVEAFAAGQGHSDSGNHNSRGALVKHHYHASNWPSKHPRYRHEVYGEVERCNWEVLCVAKWDQDVEEWATLSDDDKKKKIDEKAQADKEAQEAREAAEAQSRALEAFHQQELRMEHEKQQQQMLLAQQQIEAQQMQQLGQPQDPPRELPQEEVNDGQGQDEPIQQQAPPLQQ